MTPSKHQAARMRALRVRIVAAYLVGLNCVEIGERENLTPKAIGYHARKIGLSFPKGYPGQRRSRAAKSEQERRVQ